MPIAPPRRAPERWAPRDRSRQAAGWHRLYGRRWARAARAYLAEHPLCTDCERDGCLTPATEVDHMVAHRGDVRLFWDAGNWQALCKSCHSRKTANETLLWQRKPNTINEMRR